MSTGKRHELTDSAWAVICPLLPQRSLGRPWKDHRQVINGIRWVLATLLSEMERRDQIEQRAAR